MNLSSFIKINPADSVVVCLRPFKEGETINVDGKDIKVLQDTPAGHKVLINDTKEGENIIKYGYPIGHAREDLVAGSWVNENNLKTNLSGTLSYEYHPVNETLSIKKDNRTFKGYKRLELQEIVQNTEKLDLVLAIEQNPYISIVQICNSKKYPGIFLIATIDICIPTNGVYKGLDIRDKEEIVFYVPTNYHIYLLR